MTFKEQLDKLVEDASDYTAVPSLIDYIEGAEEVEDKVEYEGRWSSGHRAVYKHEDRYWAVEYDRPSTENQDWTTDGYECYEVQKVKKTVYDYVPIPKAGL